MRKYLFLFGSLIVFSRCSKKSDVPDAPKTPECRIVTATAGAATINITYTSQGKLSTVVQTGTNPYSRVFTYSGNVVVATTTYALSTTKDSIVLNDAGFIVQVVERHSYPGVSTHNYEYSSENVLLKVISQVNSEPATTSLFTYVNGDLVTQQENDGSTTTFTYDDQPASQGDVYYYTGVLVYSVPLVHTAHRLIAQQTSSLILNIDYATDDDGKITGLTTTIGGTVTPLTYQYSCQ